MVVRRSCRGQWTSDALEDIHIHTYIEGGAAGRQGKTGHGTSVGEFVPLHDAEFKFRGHGHGNLLAHYLRICSRWSRRVYLSLLCSASLTTMSGRTPVKREKPGLLLQVWRLRIGALNLSRMRVRRVFQGSGRAALAPPCVYACTSSSSGDSALPPPGVRHSGSVWTLRTPTRRLQAWCARSRAD